MSGGPRFPKHPLAGRGEGFVGPDGKNLFADPDSVVAASRPSNQDDNLFAPTQLTDAPLKDQHLYVATLAHRAGLAYWLAMAGLFGNLLGTFVAIQRLWLQLTAALLPLSFATFTLGFVLSCIALAFAISDLRAIRAGAMDPTGLNRLLRARFIAVIGAMWGLLGWSIVVFWFLWSLFG